MSRANTAKLYRTFAKGLITEAGFLTYPEDASSDELNTVIHRKGNRSRRLGIDFEPLYGENIIPNAEVDPLKVITSEYVWETVANQHSLNFFCMQIIDKIYFYNMAVTPLSSGRKLFTVDLQTYAAPGATVDQVKNTRVQMTAGKGYLFIVNEYIDPLVVEYVPATDTITVTKVLIQIRDFDGVHDGLANDQEPPTLSKEHFYNLRNQGWVVPGAEPAGSPPAGTTEEQTYYDPYTGEPVRYYRYEDAGFIP